MTGDSWNNGTFTKEYIKRIRKWLIAGGAASVLVGLLVLCRPVHSVAVFTVVLAVWFVLLGIARIASALTVKRMPAGWRTLDALAGVFCGVRMSRGTLRASLRRRFAAVHVDPDRHQLDIRRRSGAVRISRTAG